MTESTPKRGMTLVLGGTGKTGRRVVARLRARGLPVRVGSRSGEPPFEWDDPDTWPPMLPDVESVYVAYYPDVASPEAPARIGAFARLAAERGVRRLVLLSGRGEDGALVSERAVQEAGLAWTILRATWLSQNFSEHFLLEPVRAGIIALPAQDVAEPFVDAEDVADVAVAALTEDRHEGQVYELTGPRLLTFTEAAAEIAKATGREIHYLPVSAEQYAAALGEQGMLAEHAGVIAEMFTTVLDGRNARLADGVQRALGRPARDFSDYVRRAAATGVWAGE